MKLNFPRLLTALLAAFVSLALQAAPPRVAVLDFALENSPGSYDAATADFSQAVQARLLALPDYAWVERQELDKLTQEQDRAGLSGINSTMAVRFGRLLHADLLARGAIALKPAGGGELTVEVVDLRRAEVLASRSLPVSMNSRQQLRPTTEEVAAATEALSKALADAGTQLARPDTRVIAPLFFKNIGRTERGDFAEEKLLQAMTEAATPASGVRVLRFPRAGLASGEAGMILSGLTEVDPDAWQRVADSYVWGTIEEQDSDAKAFEDVPLRLIAQVWSGSGTPTEVKWEGPVKTLPAGLRTLTKGILTAAAAKPATRDVNERTRIATDLKKRADEVKKRLQQNQGNNNFLASATGRQWSSHRLTLLETACFFDPLNRALQEERMAATWGYENPDRPAQTLRGRWEQLADHQAQARRFERNADGSIDPAWMRQQTALLSELSQALANSSWSGEKSAKPSPEDIQRQRQAALTLWGNAVVAANASVGQRPILANAEDNTRWCEDFRNLLGDVEDPVTARAFVEQVWPALQKSIGGFLKDPQQARAGQGFVNRLYGYYDSFGEFDRAARLLDEALAAGIAPAASVSTAGSRPPRPRQDTPWQVQPAPVERKQPLGMPPSLAANENLPVLEAIVRPLEYWPTLHPFVVSTKSFLDRAAPALERTRARMISALTWHDGRLLIAENNSAPMSPSNGAANPSGNSYVWQYDPVLHESQPITPQLGGHSLVRNLVAAEQALWLALDADGVMRRDHDGTVKRFRPTDGLASSRAFVGRSAKGDLYFLGGTPPNFVISRFAQATGQWSAIPIPALSRTAAQLLASSPLPGGDPSEAVVPMLQLAVFGDWVCAATPFANLYNTSTKTWSTTALPRPPLPPGAPPPPADVPPAYAWVGADDSGFWLGGGGRVTWWNPDKPEAKKEVVVPGLVIGGTSHGPWLWLALFDGANTRVGLIDKRTMTCAGISARLPGRLPTLAAADTRLWVGGLGLTELALKIPRPAESTPKDAVDHSLMRAVWRGDLAEAERLLAAKSDVNEASASGWTPLLLAAESGRSDLVQRLLERGAKPDRFTRDGRSALLLATEAPGTALVDGLLKAGADANGWMPTRVQGVGITRSHPQDSPWPTETKTMPEQPQDLKVSFDALGRAQITWRERATGPDVRYQVTRERALIGDLPPGVGQLTDLQVPWSEKQVRYSVLAVNASGYWDPKRATEPPEVNVPLPSVPTGLVLLPGPASSAGRPIDLPAFAMSRPPLVAAAQAGRLDLVDRLLAQQANPAQTDSTGNTALLGAVLAGKYDIARALLAKGADAAWRGEAGESVAAIAFARHEDEAFFRALLSSLPLAARKLEASRLMVDAAHAGQINDLKLLQELGGDLGAFGGAALARAIGADRVETALWILDQKPPLHQVLRGPTGKELGDAPILSEAIRTNRPEIVSRLLAAGCDPNTRVDGVPLTILAAQRKSLVALRLLLDAGADRQQRAANDNRSLMEYLGPADAQTLLGAARATGWPLPDGRFFKAVPWINPRNIEPAKQALTEQLITACKAGNLAAVEAAVNAGAVLDQLGAEGRSALHTALMAKQGEVARWLVDQGASVNVASRGGNCPLNFAISNGQQPEMIEFLLEAGADINAFGYDGAPPLFAAVVSGNGPAVKRLLAASAAVNLEGNNDDAHTLVSPLGAALRRGDVEMVDSLLAAGANPKAQNYKFVQTGEAVKQYNMPSLLMYAAAGKNVRLAKQMVSLGQNPKLRSDFGEDALTWAASVGSREMVEYLLPLSERQGRALERAQTNGHTDVVRMLQQAGYQNAKP